MADAQQAAGTPYEGELAVGMEFDYEPGKKHKYERLTIIEIKDANIWARGRSGMTYYEEPAFRKSVVFVAEEPIKPTRPTPQKLQGRYEGGIEVGMVFDFEPGKKQKYERMTVRRFEDGHIWAYGRSGETFHEEDAFRDVVVPVASGSD